MKEFVDYLDDNYKDDKTEYYKDHISYLIFAKQIMRDSNGNLITYFANDDTFNYFNLFVKSSIESVYTPVFDKKFNEKYPSFQGKDYSRYYNYYRDTKLSYIYSQSLFYLKKAKKFMDERYVNNQDKIYK